MSRVSARKSRAGAACVALSLAFSLVHIPSANADDPLIEFPRSGMTVAPGETRFSGRVAASGENTNQTHVTFAVDVSGSTSSYVGDCNSDGLVDHLDDLNADGNQGSVLDCEIAAVIAMNSRLAAIPGADSSIRVSLVAFGDVGAVATIEPENRGLEVAPGWTGRGLGDQAGDILPRVDEVAQSLTDSRINKFDLINVGGGTNFDDAATTILDNIGEIAPNKNSYVFFLTDGEASVSSATLERIESESGDVKFRTFAVGSGSAGCNGSPIAAMAAASGESCTLVEDVTELASQVVESGSDTFNKVEVQVGSEITQATIDAIGNWYADVNLNTLGMQTATVRVRNSAGDVVREVIVPFEVGMPELRYVALGDSYSASEGVPPFLDPPNWRLSRDGIVFDPAPSESYACHRAENGWVRKLSGIPNLTAMDLDFQACTGARIVDLTGNRQEHTVEYAADTTKADIPSKVYNDVQLESLNAGNVGAITLTIGGNDLGFGPVIERCLLNWTGDCMGKELPGTDFTLREWANVKLALISLNYVGLYSEIRTRAPGASVTVGTYPRLVSPEGYVKFHLAPIGEGEARFLNSRVDLLAEIIKLRAGESGFDVADVRREFDGHAVGDSDSWIVGANVVPWKRQYSFHPNSSGVDAYTDVFTDVVSGEFARASMPDGRTRAVRTEAPATAEFSADDLLILTDPQAYLDSQPSDLVSMVDSTELEMLGIDPVGEECSPIEVGDQIEFSAGGFVGGAEVEVRLQDRAGNLESRTVTASDDGYAAITAPMKSIADGAYFKGETASGVTKIAYGALSTEEIPCPSDLLDDSGSL